MEKRSRTGTGGHFVHKSLWYLLYDNLRVAGHPEAQCTTLSLIPPGRTLSEHSDLPIPTLVVAPLGLSRMPCLEISAAALRNANISALIIWLSE